MRVFVMSALLMLLLAGGCGNHVSSEDVAIEHARINYCSTSSDCALAHQLCVCPPWAYNKAESPAHLMELKKDSMKGKTGCANCSNISYEGVCEAKTCKAVPKN